MSEERDVVIHPVLGEISPRLASNVMVDQALKRGLKEAHNVIISRNIEVVSRPPTQDVGPVPDSGGDVCRSFAFRLIDGTYTIITFSALVITQTVVGSEPTFTPQTTTWSNTDIAAMDAMQYEQTFIAVTPGKEPETFILSGSTYIWATLESVKTGATVPPWHAASDWPRSIGFMIGRTILVSPRKYYGSVAGDILDYDISEVTVDMQVIITAASAFSYNAADDLDQGFHFIKGGTFAFGGSPAGVWMMSNLQKGLDAQNPNLKNHNSEGTYNVKPVDTHAGMVYFTNDGVTLKNFTVSQEGALINDELNKYSKHLFEDSKPVRMVYQRTPDKTIWILKDDGTLVAFIYDELRQASLPIDVGGFINDIWLGKDNTSEYLYIDVTREEDRRIEIFDDLYPYDFDYLVDGQIVSEEEAAKDVASYSEGLNGEGIYTITGHSYTTDQLITITGLNSIPTGSIVYLTGDTFNIKLPNQSLIPYSEGKPDSVRKAVDEVTYAHLANQTIDVYQDGYYSSLPADATGKILLTLPSSVVVVGFPYECYIQPPSFSDKTLQHVAEVSKIHPKVLDCKALMWGRTYDEMIRNENNYIQPDGTGRTGTIRDLDVGGGHDDECTFYLGARRVPFVMSSCIVDINIGGN